MLKLLFAWLDNHVHAYWAIAAAPTLVLLLTLVRSIRSTNAGGRRDEIQFSLLVFAVLLAWRWPFLLSADEYNPDESQLVAGALTLLKEPVPWRSLDGTTSGPLNFFALLPAAFLGLPLDYFTARLAVIFLTGAALLACYQLFRESSGVLTARLGILPGIAFFATTSTGNFVHYSSEYVSVALTALSAWWIGFGRRDRAQKRNLEWAGCFVAGMLPWAKLQSAPLAATLVATAFFRIFRDQHRPLPVRQADAARCLFWAAAPSGLILALVAVTGQFEHFWRSYVLQNFAYVGQRESGVLADLWRAALPEGQFPLFLITSAIGIIAGISLLARRRSGLEGLLPGLLLVAAAGFSILTPGRAFLHYVLLSVVPLLLTYGQALIGWMQTLSPRSQTGLAFVVVAIGGLLPFGFRVAGPVPEILGNLSSHWSEPRTMLANTILRYAPPDARLATWGWSPTLFVQTRLPQGTRDGNTYWTILPSPQLDYYRRRFLDDLRRSEAALFVDAVGDEAFLFSNRAESGHECFPALAEYIRENYQLVMDNGSARLYARNGLEPQRHVRESPSRPDTSQKKSHIIGAMPVLSMTPSDLPQWRLRTGFVQMMHPPAEIVWSLDETTREIVVEYGIAPEAYREARTDGAELIFELHSGELPVRHLFHRFLDPVRIPADRGIQATRLVLPPLKPGATLVARTTPGPSKDASWDWIYLGRVSPIRSPGFLTSQFPHFNRVPQSAESDYGFLFEENGDHCLLLHAPSTLVFDLRGDEQRLRFEYGFREGAYTNGGQTDGAIFKVLLQSAGKPLHLIFERQLTPTSREADRGLHPADIQLPPVAKGDRMILRVESGPSAAWDWTYVTRLQVE